LKKKKKKRPYYEHKYKTGKKKHTIPLEKMIEKVKEADLSPSHEAYFWLLYWTGCRKSEAYERVVEDFVINGTHLIVDFHQRKKHGETTFPLKLRLDAHGVDKIVSQLQRAKKKNPTIKTLYVYVNKVRTPVNKKGVWAFRKIQSTTAWDIVDKVLGEDYYPHFLRLNALTEVGLTRDSITHIKDMSGIKSIKSIQAYMGMTEKGADEAMDSRFELHKQTKK